MYLHMVVVERVLVELMVLIHKVAVDLMGLEFRVGQWELKFVGEMDLVILVVVKVELCVVAVFVEVNQSYVEFPDHQLHYLDL